MAQRLCGNYGAAQTFNSLGASQFAIFSWIICLASHQFMASASNRARYWARSFAGWGQFAHVRPNAAHVALARLQQRGWVSSIIT